MCRIILQIYPVCPGFNFLLLSIKFEDITLQFIFPTHSHKNYK